MCVYECVCVLACIYAGDILAYIRNKMSKFVWPGNTWNLWPRENFLGKQCQNTSINQISNHNATE